jgi:hypothetical protein
VDEQGDTVEVRRLPSGRKVYRCKANIRIDKQKLIEIMR